MVYEDGVCAISHCRLGAAMTFCSRAQIQKLRQSYETMKLRLDPFLGILIILCLACAACHDGDVQDREQYYPYKTGQLPKQTDALKAEEYAIFVKKHPDWDAEKTQREFDRIQKMSAQKYDPDIALWADRKALANAWLKTQIEDVYSPETIGDDMIQAAIDAYAFKSGHPALLTASHLLIKPDESSTDEERRSALQAVHDKIVQSGDYTDDALRSYAETLLHAGFRADMNEDLTFPRETMTSFMGEQLSYQNVVEPFAEAAFKLSPTQKLSPIVESQFGYHIILFKSLKPGKKASIQDDRQFIVDNIVMHGRKLATAQIIQNLMNDAKVLIDEEKVNAIAGLQSNHAQEASASPAQ